MGKESGDKKGKKDKKKDECPHKSSSKPSSSHKPSSSSKPSSSKHASQKPASSHRDSSQRPSSSSASLAPSLGFLPSNLDKTKILSRSGSLSAGKYLSPRDTTKSPAPAVSVYREASKYKSQTGSIKSSPLVSISGPNPAKKSESKSSSSTKKDAPKVVSAYPEASKYNSQVESNKSSLASISSSSQPKKESTSSSLTKIDSQKVVSAYPDSSKYGSIAGIRNRSQNASIGSSSKLESRYPSGAAGSERPSDMKSLAGPSTKSTAPSFAKSTLKSKRDEEMAERQTNIESLAPRDREEQEKWAQEQIRQRGTCPANLNWDRVPGGYICTGKGHGVTDEILAEGKGGLQFLDSDCLAGGVIPFWYFGPYYLDKSFGKHGLWRYGGNLLKLHFLPEAYVPVDDGAGRKICIPVLDGIVRGPELVRLEEFERRREEIEARVREGF